MFLTERRGQERYACRGRVEVPRRFRSKPEFGVVLDLSLSGCAVRFNTQSSLAPEPEELLELKFATSYFSFRAVGAVRNSCLNRVASRIVVGFRFLNLNARGRADILAFMRDQER